MKELIAQRIINKANLLVINAVIENKDEVIRERIFFEFYKEYKRDEANSIRIALNTIDLKALATAIKENIKRGSTNYKKYTENAGIKKQITISKTYLNASTSALNIAINFNDFYEMNAFADELIFLSNYILEKLFEKQKKEI